MRIWIDNGDGHGAVEYTAALAAKDGCVLHRVLNKPTTCTLQLVCDGTVQTPTRRARLIVNRDDGLVLFTGYILAEPGLHYAGRASTGAVYIARVQAASDEWLLDRLGPVGGASEIASADVNAALGLLTSRVMTGNAALQMEQAAAAQRQTGVLQVHSDAAWSRSAATMAGASYAGYRALAGQVLLQPAASVVHAWSDADGTLTPAAVASEAVRDLANDVTVSGAVEPTVYVTEEFTGDGTTSEFLLREPAFDTQAILVRDQFTGSQLDTQVWQVSDAGNHLTLSAAGLSLNGGNGQDGVTLLALPTPVEVGGCLLVELNGVVFGAASDGMLGALYGGSPVLANCLAGWRVRQSASSSGGNTVLVPCVQGVEMGTIFTPQTGHSYTLRLRLHASEVMRVPQVYYAMVDGVVQSFGGGGASEAAVDAVFELYDEGGPASTPATVLYDSAAGAGPIVGSAAVCSFVAVNSAQLFGSIGAVQLQQEGTAWVVSRGAAGVQTRLIGDAIGTDCRISGSEAGGLRVIFFDGRVPAVNEQVLVRYRSRGRSVARIVDAASVTAEQAAGGTGVSRWAGRVLAPLTRSSADCENAATAMLAFMTSRSAAVQGSCQAVNPADDVWPGDVLTLTQQGVTESVLVRSVTLHNGATHPETVSYDISFANDWAVQLEDGLGLRLSDVVSSDAVMPATASAAPMIGLPADLSLCGVTAVTTGTLSVDAGMDPVAGGGFEIRRRDGDWGSASTGDLVMRSPVRAFSLPRATVGERFFVKAYDSSSPPRYSRWAAEIVANSPVVS